jgi:hypothetical protein
MDRTAYEVLAREAEEDEPPLPSGRGPTLSNDHDALDYLQAIYRGQIRADPTRMRAANMALPYERPKLSVATVNHRGMGASLDQAIAKLEAQRLPAEPAAPVVSPPGPSFRRLGDSPAAAIVREAVIDPPPRRKPG